MATITAVIVEVDGTVRKTEMENSLGAFQSVVGGYIEGVFRPDFTVYVNEEGIMMRLPQNERIGEVVDHPYPLLGNALILGPADEDGNETDVPASIIHHYGLDQA